MTFICCFHRLFCFHFCLISWMKGLHFTGYLQILEILLGPGPFHHSAKANKDER